MHLINVTDQFSHPDGDDHNAIAAVIHADTHAFQNEDFEAWAACWVHDERARDVCISETAGLSVLTGWTEISAHMKRVFAEDLSCKVLDFDQQNLDISITGNTAWAVFDGWSRFGTGETGKTFETRIFERHGNSWKIIYSSFLLRQDDGPDGLYVGVDAEGQIVHLTEASRSALKDHSYLTISAGRLRAHHPDWDKALQQSIRRTATHHGFFDTHKFASEVGGLPQFPVILGQNFEGGVAVVQFLIRDCMTYVRLDTENLVERRLGHAQTVFDISDAQIKVAQRIALGLSLRESALELGVTVNTARTHLYRLYEKTGVGTQAALVRLLLSVG
ncbi:MAG: nuclear transport factor 2 family protein [Rhizobiaceae bacterium]